MLRCMFIVSVVLIGMAACSLLAMFGPILAVSFKGMRRSWEPQLVPAIEAPAVRDKTRRRWLTGIPNSVRFLNRS